MKHNPAQAAEALAHTPDHQWVTTAPNPRSPATGFDAGQRGWKPHLADLPQPGAAAYGKKPGEVALRDHAAPWLGAGPVRRRAVRAL